MVFIIKSNNGARASSVAKNPENKIDVQALIEALKGLTIKLEIKLDDICFNQENGSIQITAQPKKNEEPSKSAPKSEVVPPKPTQVPVDEQPMKQLSEPIIKPEPKALREIQPQQPVEPPKRHNPEIFASSPPKPVSVVQKPLQMVNTLNTSTSRVSEDESRDPTPLETSPCSIPPKEVSPMRENISPVRKKLGKSKLIKGQLAIGQEIRTYAISISETKSSIAYIPYDTRRLQDIVDAILELTPKIEQQPVMTDINTLDIVFAKSNEDDQWYRATVEEINGPKVRVYYFDWGIHEELDSSRVRHLMSLGLSSHPACAVKVELKPNEHCEPFRSMEGTYLMKINAYNDYSETYTVTLLEPCS